MARYILSSYKQVALSGADDRRGASLLEADHVVGLLALAFVAFRVDPRLVAAALAAIGVVPSVVERLLDRQIVLGRILLDAERHGYLL